MNTNKKILITHNGSFHTDDIFTAATLSLLLEKKGESFEIVRTRDPEVIEKGDYVFDVGGIYDENTNRFDHHQKGGVGFRKVDKERELSIEYASFGLVWRKFGAELSGGEKVARIIDRCLVAPVDAFDNGFNLVESKYNASPYLIQDAFISMRPTWQEEDLSVDDMFLKCVNIAKIFLYREITQVKSALIAEEKVLEIYNKTEDKRVIILDKSYPYEYTLSNFPEPFFVVVQREADGLWGVKAVKKNLKSFKNRKDFPESWGGLRDEDLQKVTGVSDAVFCHKALFLTVAKSKEGAIKLALLSL